MKTGSTGEYVRRHASSLIPLLSREECNTSLVPADSVPHPVTDTVPDPPDTGGRPTRLSAVQAADRVQRLMADGLA